MPAGFSVLKSDKMNTATKRSDMFKPISAFAFVAVLAVLASACGPTGVTAPDPNLIHTAVAQTLSAIHIQTARAGTDTPLPSPLPPTLTPTVTLSPTPFFTETPSAPMISVSVNTNCRVGPGKVYDRVGALLVGETTEIFGRDRTGAYWYVANPDAPGGYCWLWGEYASLVGNTETLPVFTPPPTPTPVPAFEVEYDNLESCSGKWWVEFKLKNTGGITFRSISLQVADADTNALVAISDDDFINYNGCTASESRKALGAGETLILSAPSFVYDPSGHKLRASMTLCSDDGVKGICLTKALEFKP